MNNGCSAPIIVQIYIALNSRLIWPADMPSICTSSDPYWFKPVTYGIYFQIQPGICFGYVFGVNLEQEWAGRIRKACAACGLADKGLQPTRICLFKIDFLKRNRGDILTVSKRLGPSKSSVTLDIYGHIVTGVQEKATAIMDEIAPPITMESM